MISVYTINCYANYDYLNEWFLINKIYDITFFRDESRLSSWFNL
jgi:hypothetical protein